jgi:hypothetical protein
MVKADNLVKQQKEREDRKIITFAKILNKIEKKIVMASNGNFYYTWYSLPEFFVGLPMYSLEECKDYIKKKLKKDGFKITFYEPNIFLITWLPKKK